MTMVGAEAAAEAAAGVIISATSCYNYYHATTTTTNTTTRSHVNEKLIPPYSTCSMTGQQHAGTHTNYITMWQLAWNIQENTPFDNLNKTARKPTD